MRVCIIGFGRFGKTVFRLIKDDFTISIFDTDLNSLDENYKSFIAKDITDALMADVLIICVPINKLSGFINNAQTHLHGKVIIDTLSVKVHPERVLNKLTQSEVILTHPMFGPDSTKEGFKGHSIVMHNQSAKDNTYKFWYTYFLNKGLRIVELSPRKHDKLAAKSQGVTHFLGRVLKEYEFSSTEIDTAGAKKLGEIMHQTCNDSFELFHDLQTYNPYTNKMRIEFGRSFEKISSKLLPKRVNIKYIVYGIQGGKGSFNEEALLSYISMEEKYKIKYLFTTKNVLTSLTNGDIDFGLFAISNTLGGIVDETIEVLGDYKFTIVDQITLNIRHFLMKRKDIDISKITHITAHPQVIKQCRNTLFYKYPNLKTVNGTGVLIDTANAAKALSEGKLNINSAILGPKILSNLYNLDIIDSDLQDNKDNRTTFLLVKRHT